MSYLKDKIGMDNIKKLEIRGCIHDKYGDNRIIVGECEQCDWNIVGEVKYDCAMGHQLGDHFEETYHNATLRTVVDEYKANSTFSIRPDDIQKGLDKRNENIKSMNEWEEA